MDYTIDSISKLVTVTQNRCVYCDNRGILRLEVREYTI